MVVGWAVLATAHPGLLRRLGVVLFQDVAGALETMVCCVLQDGAGALEKIGCCAVPGCGWCS